MSSTNTYTSAPTCENCGRDKQATYICDPCCDKLNAMHRDLRADRDRLAAENAALEAMLANEVAENVRLRSREVGDEVGNLLQEVADLKNELARVKAESLRVVADGEQCAVEIIPTGLRVAIHGRQGIFRRVGSGAAANPLRSFLLFEDCHSGNEIEVEYGSLGTPVRLERWEDEG